MSGHQRSGRSLETLEARLLLARHTFRSLSNVVEEPTVAAEIAPTEQTPLQVDLVEPANGETTVGVANEGASEVTSEVTAETNEQAIEVAAVASNANSDQHQIKIALVGDSVTSGIRADVAADKNIPATTSYRPYLWEQIATSRPDLDVRFVGPTANNSRNSAATDAWEGLPDEATAHAGYAGLTSSSFLPGSNAATDPHGTPGRGADGWATYDVDIAVMLVGINDLISGHSLSGSARSVETSVRGMITALRLDNPSVDILLGTMPEVSDRFSFAADVAGLNEILADISEPDGDWIGSTEDSPIQIVDHANGITGLPVYDVELHSGDGLHPNTEGDILLAANWWSTLEKLLPANATLSPLPSKPAAPATAENDDEPTSDAAIESNTEESVDSGEPSIAIRVAELAITEGETTKFVVSRNGNLDSNQSIELRVSGNAKAEIDYAPLPQSLHFEVGVSEIIVDLVAIDDGLDEFDEFITLSVRELEGYLTDFGSSILIRNR